MRPPSPGCGLCPSSPLRWAHMHARVHMYTCAHMHVLERNTHHIYTCTYTHHIYTCTYTHAHIHTTYTHAHIHTCVRIQPHSIHMQTAHTPPAPLAHTHLWQMQKHTCTHVSIHVHTIHSAHTQAHTHPFAALHSKSGVASLHSVPI